MSNRPPSAPAEPLVSLCCSTYNHENYIRDCIEGFLIQETDFPFEIIIHDDASTDTTPKIIQDYADQFPHLIFPVYQEENQYSKGKKPFVNFVSRRTSGKYIALCEGDDYWTDRNKIKRQVDFLESNKDYVICYHDAMIIDENDRILQSSKLSDDLKVDFTSDELIKGNMILTLSMCFRNVLKDFPDEIGPVFNGDKFLTSLLGNFGKGKYMTDIAPAVYRKHSEAVWSSLDQAKQIYHNAVTRSWLHRYYRRIGQNIYAPYFKNEAQNLFISALKRAKSLSGQHYENLANDILTNYSDIMHSASDHRLLESPKSNQKFHNIKQKPRQFSNSLSKNFNIGKDQIDLSDNRYSDEDLEWLPETYFLKSVFYKTKVLLPRLKDKRWQNKKETYTACFDSVTFQHTVSEPAVSIIVISWRLHPDSLKNFQILEKQRDQNFELIFVDNGGKDGEFETLKQYVDTYVRLNRNTGAYLARNIGALFAKAPLLLFLEDDGIPDQSLIRAHLDLYQEYDIIACRGLYIPKTNNPLNDQQGHYYVGDKEYPTFAHVEGNTSYLSETFFRVGGWDDDIRFGGGGLELYFRLLTIEPDKRKQIYSPAPIIHHDYAKDETHFKEKRNKQALSFERLRKKYPLWDETIRNYRLNITRDDLLIKKNADWESQSKSPEISIVTIVGDDPRPVMKTLDSLINQDLLDTEIIVVYSAKDASIKSAIATDWYEDIKFLEIDSNEDVTLKNKAIEHATGRYIMWIGAGVELIDPTAISLFKSRIKAHFDADILYSHKLAIQEKEKSTQKIYFNDWYTKNDMLAETLKQGLCIPMDLFLIRKNVYLLEGFYEKTGKPGCDYEFLRKIAAKKIYNMKRINDVLYKSSKENTYVSLDDAFRYKERKVDNVLFINHNIYPYEISGTPLTTLNQAVGLTRRGLKVAVLYPSFKVKEGFIKDRSRGFTTYQVPARDKFEAYLTGPGEDRGFGFKKTIEDIIDDFSPQIVHVNDYTYMPAEVIEICSRKGCFIVRSVCNCEEFCHRDYPVIASGLDGRLCPGPESPKRCAECLLSHSETAGRKRNKEVTSRSNEEKIQHRFEYIKRLYRDTVDKVIFTSEPFKKYFTGIAPVPENKMKVIPRGFKFDYARQLEHVKKTDRKIHFAFIGHIMFSKGIDVVLKAFEKIHQNNDFVLHLYGELLDTEHYKWIDDLQTRFPDKFILYGRFDQASLPTIATNIDICIIPSYFDTYNRVLREILYLGVPVIVTDFFGAGIVENGWNGYKIPIGDANALAQKMVDIIGDPSVIEKLSRGAQQTRIPSLDQEIDQFLAIYNDLYRQSPGAKRHRPGRTIRSGQRKKSSIDETTRLIAFYLPQYHPIPENDKWWGKGFTEWTNVTNAKPLFPGHYQPHLPADLGFYDLRLAEVREDQAEMAKKYGISGFCYYHYWFNGHRLLHRVFDEVLKTGKPDFPFCLCWANENWTRGWDGGDQSILIKQSYSERDDKEHIAWLIKAFRDPRYIKIQDRPLLLIYRVNLIPEPEKTAALWRKKVKQAGFPDLYLCSVESLFNEQTAPQGIGFDASVEFQPTWSKLGPKCEQYQDLNVFEYGEIVDRMLERSHPDHTRFPCVTPSWDNTPRRKNAGVIFRNSTPRLYERWLRHTLAKVQNHSADERIVFINAWNEWGEGNHLEPDLRCKHAYLMANRRALLIDADNAQFSEDLTGRAAMALEAGYLGEAEQLLREAFSHDPLAPRTLHLYATLKYHRGHTDQAAGMLAKAMELDPSNAEIVNDIGVLYHHMGFKDEALTHFLRAIELDDSLIEAKKNFADLHAEVGRTMEAQKLYREILTRHPNDSEALTALKKLCKTSKGPGMKTPVIHAPSKKPTTSIIIPCFNQLTYTKKCLKSIARYTTAPYELLLVDNGSTDTTRAYLLKYAEGLENVHLILNDENLGFAAANNQGLQKAMGDYILLLNNDVVVTEGWLGRLISKFETSLDIGMVGPMSNSASGDQMVGNVPYKKNLNAMHSFAQKFAEDNHGKTTETSRLVGFCLLVRKEVLDVIGGFDENYVSGNFEDDDLCLKSTIAGYKNMIAGDVFIHHYGSMTFKGNAIDYSATMKRNLIHFKEKWQDIIEVIGTGYRIHLTKEQQVQKLIQWGEDKYLSGDLRSAINIFDRALKLDNRNSRAWSNLGVIQWQLGKEDSAIDGFQKALLFDPKDPDALANLVQGVGELSRYDLIQNDLVDLVRQFQPENPDFQRLAEFQRSA